jgi:hypothetical protein
MPTPTQISVRHQAGSQDDSLLIHPKLQKEVHQAPSTTSHAESPPSKGGESFSSADSAGEPITEGFLSAGAVFWASFFSVVILMLGERNVMLEVIRIEYGAKRLIYARLLLSSAVGRSVLRMRSHQG